jgi:hypothetical protein
LAFFSKEEDNETFQYTQFGMAHPPAQCLMLTDTRQSNYDYSVMVVWKLQARLAFFFDPGYLQDVLTCLDRLTHSHLHFSSPPPSYPFSRPGKNTPAFTTIVKTDSSPAFTSSTRTSRYVFVLPY